ncbi:SWI/SNF and RSC complex subunit Ssr3, partial [Coemansia sp. RSA 2603]
EFLNAMTVELDRSTELYGENTVQWRRAAGVADVDGFEIKRRGDENVRAIIALDLRTATDRFKVNHPLLRELLDIRGPITKAAFIMKLWQYIKLNNLQDSDDPDQIRCDAGLLQVFNTPVVSFTAIPQMLHTFLVRPDPLVIEYTVRVHAGEYHMADYAFDVEVELEDYAPLAAGPLATVQARTRDLASIDDQLAMQMQEIHNARSKRDFLRNFADDPVAFIHRWIDNQTKDLEVILGDRRHALEAAISAIMAGEENGTSGDAEAAKWLKESALYNEAWASEAVIHYVAAKTEELKQQQIVQQQQQQLQQQQQQQMVPQQHNHSAAGQMQN